jgi:hypothetical protein
LTAERNNLFFIYQHETRTKSDRKGPTQKTHRDGAFARKTEGCDDSTPRKPWQYFLQEKITLMLTTKKINRAISHTGLQVWGNGDGYFYFLDLKTGVQRGTNVNVCKLNHAPLAMWIECAEIAAKSNLFEGFEIC